MENVTQAKPLLGTEVGCKPGARCNSRFERLYGSRVRPQYVGAGAAGHAIMADCLVQLCTAPWCRIYSPRHAGPGNSCAGRWRCLLRYRSTAGIVRLRWARFPGSKGSAWSVSFACSAFSCHCEPACAGFVRRSTHCIPSAPAAAVYASVERQHRAGAGQLTGSYGFVCRGARREIAERSSNFNAQQPKCKDVSLCR